MRNMIGGRSEMIKEKKWTELKVNTTIIQLPFQMLKLFNIVLFACIIFLGSNLYAQENTSPFYRCLVGDYINSPTLINYMKQNNLELGMYNFLDSKGYIGDNIIVKNGKVDHIYLKREATKDWPPNLIPQEWNIKTPYKKMYSTDKSYPRPPKNKYSGVKISKPIDSLNIELQYGSKSNKHGFKQALDEVWIRGDASYCTGCISNIPPPNIWKNFIGENGDGLCTWLCEDMGKALPYDYIENNFIPIKTITETDSCPEYNHIYPYKSFYDIHPFLSGKYFMSIDGTTIIRIDKGVVKSLVFFPQLIPVQVLPSINKNYIAKYVKSMYPELYNNEKEEGYYVLHTSNFQIDFNFQESSNLRSICINLREDKTSGGSIKQFPFIAANMPQELINISCAYDIYDEVENEIIRKYMDNAYKFLRRNKFKLKEGYIANYERYIDDGMFYHFLVEVSDGVNEVEFEILDKKGNVIERTIKEPDNSLVGINFMGGQSVSGRIKIRIKNVSSYSSEAEYDFKLHSYYHDVYDVLTMPDSNKEWLKEFGYEQVETFEILSFKGKWNCARFSIYSYTQYFVFVSLVEGINNMDISISGDTSGLVLGRNDKSTKSFDRWVEADVHVTSFEEGHINITIKDAESSTQAYPIKVYLYKRKAGE
jgi:hypothetical protein